MMCAHSPVRPIVFIFIIFLNFSLQGQSLKDHVQKGDRFYERKDYGNAWKNYKEALALDPDDPHTNYKAGISALHEDNFSQAVQCLERAYLADPNIDPDISYHIGMAYQKNHQFGEARKHFQTVKEKNKRMSSVASQKIKECILGDSIMKLRVDGEVEVLNEVVNSSFSEFAPLITHDGNTLVFTSDRSDDAYEVKSGTNSEDVYMTRKMSGVWATPEKIGMPINVKFHEAATYITPDGNTMLLYYEDGGGDIYTSSLVDNKWSNPQALNKFINHPQYRESSACISRDGKRLYFSSNRPGGRGGFDIYVCLLSENGQWGRPSNLGSTVNTKGDEEWPFLHADDVTLFFASTGHATLGDYDIFKTVLSQGRWSRPENLGYPINSSSYEGHFVMTEGGATGYFSSLRKQTETGSDIYQVTFSPSSHSGQEPVAEVIKPASVSSADHNNIVTNLRGRVIDVTDTSPLVASIRLVDNSSKTIVSSATSDAEGNFELVIPQKGNYGLTTEKAGYMFNSMNFNVPAFDKYQEIDTHILMVKGTVGSKVILKNIFFDVNKSELRPESLSELENIRELLASNPAWKIQINGHTDNVGHPEANRALSLKRAQSVVAYLVQQGVSPSRLKAKGFGSEKPLVSNDDEKEGRQINRRTEIEIIE